MIASYVAFRTQAVLHQNRPKDAQKGRPARPQRTKRRIVLVPYGEPLSDARTPLADFFRILLEQNAPGVPGGERPRCEIPVDEEEGGLFAGQGEESLAPLCHDAFGLPEIQRAVLTGPIADEQRQSRVLRAAFPLAIRAVQAGCPGS